MAGFDPMAADYAGFDPMSDDSDHKGFDPMSCGEAQDLADRAEANTTKAFADAMVVRRRRQQEILDTLAAAKAECLADPETAKYADDDYDDYDHDHVDDDAPTTKWI